MEMRLIDQVPDCEFSQPVPAVTHQQSIICQTDCDNDRLSTVMPTMNDYSYQNPEHTTS